MLVAAARPPVIVQGSSAPTDKQSTRRDIHRSRHQDGTSPGTTITIRTISTIPAMTSFGPFPGDLILGLYVSDVRRSETTLEVRYNGSSVVCDSDPDYTCSWMAYVQPARDRHEQNVESFRDSHGRIHFRCVREIRKGEELYVWYGHEMARHTAIPVLTPAHIRGDQDYNCTKCHRSFRFPNVLKSHIRFHCPLSVGLFEPLMPPPAHVHSREKHELSALSRKDLLGIDRDLMSAFRPHKESPEQRSSPKEFSPKSNPFQNTLLFGRPTQSNKSAKEGSPPCVHDVSGQYGFDLLNPAALSHFPSFIFPPPYLEKLGLPHYNTMYSRLYSGLPYGGTPTNPSVQASTLSESAAALYHLYGIQPVSPALHVPPTPQEKPLTKQVPSPAPESHTKSPTVSPPNSMPSPTSHISVADYNFPMPSEKAGEPLDLLPKSLYMNKSRKGHLCIYCGKLYSRKYGLKIHLRTHTGYKPLKCKVCLRPFGDPSNLNKHIRLHAEGETPYRCQFCGKVLVRRRDLERHIRSRHPNETVEGSTDVIDGDDIAIDSAPDSSDGDHEIDDSFDEQSCEIQVDV